VNPTTLGLVMFGGMLLLMAVRTPIAAAMFIPGAVGYWALTSESALLNQLKGTAVARLTVYELSVIPLFLLMGQFATQGGLSRALFRAAAALVVYAILTEQNIGKLFAAAMVPGLLAMLGYIFVVGIVCRLQPHRAPALHPLPWAQRWQALWGIWPIVVIFFVVFGGIYTGVFSPTEGAAVGAVATLVADWISHLQLSPLVIVGAVLVFYVMLGCVMDELSMMLLTIPALFPAIMDLDLWGLNAEARAIWFGILVLMTVGIGMTAPPVGLNVYVVNSIAGEVSMRETYRGVMPFLVWDVLRLTLMLFFPVLTLGLVGWFY